MRRRIGVAVLALGLLAAWGVAGEVRTARLLRQPSDAPLPASLEAQAVRRGAHVFSSQCASCHGDSGRGGADFAGPDLADKDWLYGVGAVSEIEQTVAYGVRSHHPKGWNLAAMPAYGRPDPTSSYKIPPLAKAEIDDVMSYLASRADRPTDAAATARGKLIFDGRGGCFDCHGGDARGDPAIGAPNLVDQVWLFGGAREQIFASIYAGRHAVMPAFADRLSAADLRSVAVYVHALSHPASADAKEPG